jgi:catechol 2,3-dioxygenase-like lactoylglutathione lyase family enzyme
MRIRLTKVYVDDQDKALRFYTDVLGFRKKADVKQEGYRWLTVVSPEEPDGTGLLLERGEGEAVQAFQRALFEGGQPAALFETDDVRRDHERLVAAGVAFTLPPTEVTGSTIAILDDTCGNLIQLAQYHRRRG